MSKDKAINFIAFARCIKIGFIAICAALMAFPFAWMVLSSLKTKAELMSGGWLPSDPQWLNYLEAIRSPLLRNIGNSLAISAASTAYQLVSGAMLAYALAYMSFKGKGLIFALIMGSCMAPSAATYIPSYIILSKMKLLDSYTGLVVSSLVSVFGIFLLRQAFMQVPPSLIEAARLDSASHWRTLWKVVYPVAKPSFAAFVLINAIASYNSYMWPSLVTNSPDLYMVSQGLRHFFIEGGAYGTNWPLVMAGSAIVVLPLLAVFALLQKWFVSGLSGSAGLKG
ncbi:MAG: carbohydrate ABC transporter permease [Clostridiales bacterium]|nr:carbohydrate ABC transporter permease [Clostridiales bacterium]